LAELIGQREMLEQRIRNLNEFEQGRSALRIEQEELLVGARNEQIERRAALDLAISAFNSNSEELYVAPGKLVVDVGQRGFKFDVEIERSRSQGIEQMKIFCYDLMLAELWARRGTGPGFLIHDSTLFDGVDERQVAKALQLAFS
jgi:uncharacterized protein YydD (DUF2326 family)